MFRLPEAWVWDFWLADDGQKYHLFFLYASRALGNPDLRHYRASIGHAVSDDLINWDRVVDALVRSDAPAFDDLATWTGSVVRDPGDDTWYMFYTGATQTPAGNVQKIGYATSQDLFTWRRGPANPILQAEPPWYEKLADGTWHDEAFRDPWVLQDPQGNGWHMLITARTNHGPTDNRGVIGHAWSPDLEAWQLRPPLSAPGQGFAQLEVVQTARVDGQDLLMFSALAKDMSAARARGRRAGCGSRGPTHRSAPTTLPTPNSSPTVTDTSVGSSTSRQPAESSSSPSITTPTTAASLARSAIPRKLTGTATDCSFPRSGCVAPAARASSAWPPRDMGCTRRPRPSSTLRGGDHQHRQQRLGAILERDLPGREPRVALRRIPGSPGRAGRQDQARDTQDAAGGRCRGTR